MRCLSPTISVTSTAVATFRFNAMTDIRFSFLSITSSILIWGSNFTQVALLSLIVVNLAALHTCSRCTSSVELQSWIILMIFRLTKTWSLARVTSATGFWAYWNDISLPTNKASWVKTLAFAKQKRVCCEWSSYRRIPCKQQGRASNCTLDS